MKTPEYTWYPMLQGSYIKFTPTNVWNLRLVEETASCRKKNIG
jgi:hypothetical protein